MRNANFQKRPLPPLLAFVLLCLMAPLSCRAFSVHPPSVTTSSRRIPVSTVTLPYTGQDTTALRVAAEDSADDDSEVDTAEASAEGEDKEEKEQEEEEDPELVALKEEIAKAEADLKEKRRAARSAADRADDFSEAGYARKVAEMEQMRRTRRMLQSSDSSASTASILSEFLPVLDKLQELKAKFEDDAFGKQYNALPGTLRSVFDGLDAAEFTVKTGDSPIDVRRVRIVEDEYSEEYAKGTVLRPISIGWELQGNVIRKAECVASLGSEAAEEEEPEETEQDDSEETDEE